MWGEAGWLCLRPWEHHGHRPLAKGNRIQHFQGSAQRLLQNWVGIGILGGLNLVLKANLMLKSYFSPLFICSYTSISQEVGGHLHPCWYIWQSVNQHCSLNHLSLSTVNPTTYTPFLEIVFWASGQPMLPNIHTIVLPRILQSPHQFPTLYQTSMAWHSFETLVTNTCTW